MVDVASSRLMDAGYWRDRAEEARTIGDLSKEAETRRIMFGIATSYDMIAERAEKRAAVGNALSRA